MNVLLTGAFGNIGTSALDELLAAGHQVRCFDVLTPLNRKTARRYQGRAEIVWGDLRAPDQVAAAVAGQEAVIHLAFVIPKLSVTGVESEARPDWSRQINVGGTCNVLAAIQAQQRPPRLIFSSSYHVYGPTQDQPPPRTIHDPVQPVEHYARHKVECEERIRSSGLTWAIFRFAAALPLALKLDRGMFDIPLMNRMEYVHTRDVGLALAHAVESDAIWGKTLHIGGGPRCQYYYYEIVDKVLGGMGIGPLPGEAFGSTPFATDWVDTTESEALLRYQTRDLEDYVQEMTALLGARRPLIRLLRPWVRAWLLRRSPYYARNRALVRRRPATRTA